MKLIFLLTISAPSIFSKERDTQEFLTWRFKGEYSFYDNSIQQEKIDSI